MRFKKAETVYTRSLLFFAIFTHYIMEKERYTQFSY